MHFNCNYLKFLLFTITLNNIAGALPTKYTFNDIFGIASDVNINNKIYNNNLSKLADTRVRFNWTQTQTTTSYITNIQYWDDNTCATFDLVEANFGNISTPFFWQGPPKTYFLRSDRLCEITQEGIIPSQVCYVGSTIKGLRIRSMDQNRVVQSQSPCFPIDCSNGTTCTTTLPPQTMPNITTLLKGVKP